MRLGSDQLNKAELQLFRRLTDPVKIQKYLDDLPYNKERDGETCRSPRRVIRDETAHCFEAALFGAAAMRMNGHQPLILDLEAVRDDDHVIAIYRLHGGWGAIAKSNYAGLRFREPVYRTLRELVMSYFEGYYNLCGREDVACLLTAGQPCAIRSNRVDNGGRGSLGDSRVSGRYPPHADTQKQ